MKKTKLLTSLAALALVLGLGSCENLDVDKPEDETEDTTQEGELEGNEPEAHTHAYVLEYVAPTCLEDGSVTFTCSDCKDTITESIPALGHDFENGAYGYDATNHWKVCARCGQKGTESAHETTSETIAATCTQAGLTVTSCECGYTTSEAINPTGHTWEVSETTAATCTADGKTTYKCSECEETYEVTIPKTGHDWQVTGGVTGNCTTAAEVTYTCSYCSATHTDVTPASGHTFGNGVVTLLPTCTDSGEVVFTCTVCSETLTVTLDPTDLNHDYSETVCTGSEHYTACSRCGAELDGSRESCTYKLNQYGYDVSGALHRACDVCNGLSTDTVETPTANADGTYDYVANSSASLDSALGALANVESTDDGAQSTITLTEDLDLTDSAEGAAYEFSASNFILDGGEDGVTLDVGNQSTVSGENVTFSNLTLDGSEVSGSTRRNAAVKVTGKDVTFDGCTIVGGSSTGTGNGLDTAGIIVTSSEANSTITVSNCDITGADRAIYFYNAASDINLYVSDTYLEAVYAFNKTGSGTGSITFVNSTLMGWTSYAESGEVTFTGCTFGFGDNNANQCYGFLRGYSDATFTDCLFRSFVSRQTETENDLTNLCSGEEPIGHDTYMFGVGAASVIYTLLNCSFEHVCDEHECNEYEIETLTEDNAGYLMSTDYAKTSYSACGFKFSTNEDATVYTYSDYSDLFNVGN